MCAFVCSGKVDARLETKNGSWNKESKSENEG